MSSAAANAVFLSYASQDAEAARKICDALRAAQVEVWFDQSELVGGDAWDAKIRKQIAECALFVPIISASTQARREGYFRLEWKLAAQRTHMISARQAFLVPVVIDATHDREADVPEEFRAVQWTRLQAHDGPAPGPAIDDIPLAKFVGRVKSRLTAEQKTSGLPPGPKKRHDTPVRPRAARRGWARGAIGAGVAAAVIAGGLMVWNRVEHRDPPARAEAKPAGPKRGLKSVAVLPLENLSEDRQGSAFFVEGMHVDLIAQLQLIRELNCVPHTTMANYRGTKKSVREIANELGVAFVLTGTVQRGEKKLRVTSTLVDAHTDSA